jgi:dienelactone hydrolase
MTPIEIAAFVLSLGALLSRFGLPAASPWLIGLAGLALAAAVCVNPARWQLYPGLIGLAVLAALLWQPQRFGTVLLISGGVLIGLSALLAQMFAMSRLPAPSGPYAVGTVAHALERQAGTEKRPLFLKIWYPARQSPGDAEGLWSDLQDIADIPWGMRKGLAYASGIRTHSQPGAPYAVAAGQARVVIYNHSFVSWASENSLLTEDLASRGYVVVAIRHRGQMEEYRTLDSGIEKTARMRDLALQKQLGAAKSREERARLSAQLAEIGMAAEIMRRRTADSHFVADRLVEVLGAVPGMAGKAPASYSAMGFSLGGAISTGLCVDDPRCRAVVNIDGGIPGVDYRRLKVPHYLMIYGRANIGGSDAVRAGAGSGYEERIFPEAAHADFHDSAIALPATRWFFGRSVSALTLERREMADRIAQFLARSSD